MSRFTTLRSYFPMARRSDKLRDEEAAYLAVYVLVDQRSEGRCEAFGYDYDMAAGVVVARCPKRATDHHHCVKPRRSHHDPDQIVHLCRAHHDRCDWPYQRGRLVVTPLGGGRFTFAILTEKPR